MNKKIKVLRIIPTLDKSFGGPTNTILDNSSALIKSGIKVDILTYDKKKNYFVNNRVKIINKGPAIGNYKFSLNLLFWLIKNKSKYDLFIIHGIFQFSTLIARLILKNKYFVFIHGALDPYFSSEFFKCLKKKIYWRLIEKQNLLNAKSIILTNNAEKNQLAHTYVNTTGIKKSVVEYGISKPKFNKKRSQEKFYNKFPKLKNRKFLLFLGRFHKKKGLDVLINSLRNISKKNIHINVLMVGPYSKYKEDLINKSKIEGLNDNIFWSDTLSGELKWGAITSSKGMVLPSNGENFGVSLVESLSCSRPVLTTYKVNIYNKILQTDSGLISHNKTNDFTKILLKFNSFNDKQIKQYSQNSLKCFNENFNIDKKINSLVKILRQA